MIHICPNNWQKYTIGSLNLYVKSLKFLKFQTSVFSNCVWVRNFQSRLFILWDLNVMEKFQGGIFILGFTGSKICPMRHHFLISNNGKSIAEP